MPRKKSYDRDTAVEAAMRTFWSKGYTNVGVRQIERETSINRFALQTEFGGKEGLFLEALNAYLKLFKATALKPLDEGGLDGITCFFRNLVAGEADDPRNAGCLMVNTVVENADLGLDSVREITTASYDHMQATFELALETAKRQGEISPGFDVPAAARFLLTFAMGIEVYVRMNADVGAARQQVDFLLREIESWRLADKKRPAELAGLTL